MKGWYPLTRSEELPRRTVLPRRLDGQELVVWRGGGRPYALDAYCDHLGAHLGYNGTVVGEDVRCFFHAWTWSSEGRNTDIPYSDRTHKGRSIRPWTTAEQAGFVLVWKPAAVTDRTDEPDWAAPDLGLPGVADLSHTATERALIDPAVLLENLVDPHAVRRLLATSATPTPEVVEDEPGCFRVRHHFGDATVEVVLHGPGLAIIHSTTAAPVLLGFTPTGTDLEIRAAAHPRTDLDGLIRRLRVAEDMAFTADPALTELERPVIERFRRWLARTGEELVAVGQRKEEVRG